MGPADRAGQRPAAGRTPAAGAGGPDRGPDDAARCAADAAAVPVLSAPGPALEPAGRRARRAQRPVGTHAGRPDRQAGARRPDRAARALRWPATSAAGALFPRPGAEPVRRHRVAPESVHGRCAGGRTAGRGRAAALPGHARAQRHALAAAARGQPPSAADPGLPGPDEQRAAMAHAAARDRTAALPGAKLPAVSPRPRDCQPGAGRMAGLAAGLQPAHAGAGNTLAAGNRAAPATGPGA